MGGSSSRMVSVIFAGHREANENEAFRTIAFHYVLLLDGNSRKQTKLTHTEIFRVTVVMLVPQPKNATALMETICCSLTLHGPFFGF